MEKKSVFEIFRNHCIYGHDKTAKGILVDGKKFTKKLCMHEKGPTYCEENRLCPIFPVVGESL